MDAAKMTLEFVKVLIWPVAIVLLLLTFRTQIKRMLLDMASRLTGAKLPGGTEFEFAALKDKTEEAVNKTEEIATNRLEALGWIYTEFSTISYRRYEALWRRQNYAREVNNDLEFRENVEDAIRNAQQALKCIEDEQPQNPTLLTMAKNNLAYHLATRRASTDKWYAHQLVREVLQTTDREPDYLETQSWVLLRFSEMGSPQEQVRERNEGVRITRQLIADTDIPIEWRNEVRKQYEGVFGLGFGVTEPYGTEGGLPPLG